MIVDNFHLCHNLNSVEMYIYDFEKCIISTTTNLLPTISNNIMDPSITFYPKLCTHVQKKKNPIIVKPTSTIITIIVLGEGDYLL